MAEAYQLHIWLRHISPMIGRRLLVRSETSLYDLHYILQIAFAWSDAHLHQFLIRGKSYGITRPGCLCFADDPKQVLLSDFHFRLQERFVYEYDFFCWWQHQVRVEKMLPLEPYRTYPSCIGGQRAAPPEDCGGPQRFLALRQHYTLGRVLPPFVQGLKALLEAEDNQVGACRRRLRPLAYWLTQDRFDRRRVNRRLRQYAQGDPGWKEDMEFE